MHFKAKILDSKFHTICGILYAAYPSSEILKKFGRASSCTVKWLWTKNDFMRGLPNMIIFKFKTGSGHSLNSSIHFFGKGELAGLIIITVFRASNQRPKVHFNFPKKSPIFIKIEISARLIWTVSYGTYDFCQKWLSYRQSNFDRKSRTFETLSSMNFGGFKFSIKNLSKLRIFEWAEKWRNVKNLE